MKIIKLKKHITVILDDGTLLTNSNCTDEMYNQVLDNQEDEETVKCVLVPELCKKQEEIEIKTALLENLSNSKYLTRRGQSLYIESISQLTVPEDLATALYKAEQEEDKDRIQTYLNFWTLCSLNPDSRARTNLFWFLNKYGMTISKSGLFVAYRNVNLKKEGSTMSSNLASFISDAYAKIKYKQKQAPSKYNIYEDEEVDMVYYCHKNTVNVKDKEFIGNLEDLYKQLGTDDVAPTYTDGYTGTFNIKIGEVVSMPREKCDSVQENTCSNGLHVAGKGWLSRNYFGGHSLMVLVNPTDVVAVPHADNYGKMRTCAYYPIQVVQWDKEGNIIDNDIEDGFEDDFIDTILYQGEINNEDTGNYSVKIPSIPEIDRSNILDRLEDIKSQVAKKKVD